MDRDDQILGGVVLHAIGTALHRSGGYRPTTVSEQRRRWGWRLLRWWQAGTGFDPGMELWLRPAPGRERSSRLWRELAATGVLDLLLLLVLAWRAPRAEVGALALLGTLAATVVVLLGAREVAIRLVARQQELALGHVPWANAIGLSGLLAAALGVWLPAGDADLRRRTVRQGSVRRPGARDRRVPAGGLRPRRGSPPPNWHRSSGPGCTASRP